MRTAEQQAKFLAYQRAYNSRPETKEKKRQEYLANREKRLEQARAYRIANRQKMIDYLKQWRQDNPVKFKEGTERWRKANMEKHRHYGRQYKLRNREKVRASSLEYYRRTRDKNKNKRQEYHRKRWETDPEYRKRMYIAHMNRRARIKGSTVNPKSITSFIRRVKSMKTAVCYYCESRVPSKDIHFDHIIPLSKGGAHSIENLCTSCSHCNHSKNSTPIQEWMRLGQQVLAL